MEYPKENTEFTINVDDEKDDDQQDRQQDNNGDEKSLTDQRSSSPAVPSTPLEAELGNSKTTKVTDDETTHHSREGAGNTNKVNNDNKNQKDNNKVKEKDTAHDLAVEDALAALPPPLERTQARQISRVGATAVAGIGTSTIDTTSDGATNRIEFPTAGPGDDHDHDHNDEENNNCSPNAPPLVAHSSLGTVASNTTAGGEVMATLVSDDEYQADLRRAIMRTSVQASKVEMIPETTPTGASSSSKKYRSLLCAGVCIVVIAAFILASVFVYVVKSNDTPTTADSDDNDQISAEQNDPAPGAVDEDVLVNFLIGRSFDGGEALREYASPQRVAFRYIEAEFPTIPMDEKLIDMYAVATFFFSTGGISWTNTTKWKSSDPVCFWHGIDCDENGYVTAIELANNALAGVIPRELGMLAPRQIGSDDHRITGLKRLDLSNNRIQGTIPEQVGLLTSIERFLVNDNGLWGSIPAGISKWGESLQVASFADNSLRGTVPKHLCYRNNAKIAIDCDLVNCSCCSCDDEQDSIDDD